MYRNKKVVVIIVAAGRGSRMNSELPKQFMFIAGKTILDTTLYKFETNKYIDEIILVVNVDDAEFVQEDIAPNYEKIIEVVIGGQNRTESVYNAIKIIKDDTEIVLIHDGVRPFVSHNLINTCIENTYEYKACIPVVDIVDTIKSVEEGFVKKTIDRNMLKSVQTPQGFDFLLIKECYDKVVNGNNIFTDDSSILEYYDIKVKTIEGLGRNIKITTPLDLRIAEILSSIY